MNHNKIIKIGAAAGLLLVFSVLLFRCGSVPPPRENGLQVVTTVFPPYDFTRAVVGENATVSMLLPPAAESHSFEPTVQDMIRIQNCDVFIYVGGDSDAWVERILGALDVSRVRVITLMDCVELVTEEITPEMNAEPEDEPEYDEHVWTNPRNAKRIVQKISDTVCAAAPKSAALFRANTEQYLKQLDVLDQKFRDIVDTAARNTLVFGDRFPFRYFVDAYGLQYAAAYPGCSTETEPSAKTVARLIDKIKAEHLPVVFHVELSNQNMARSISEQTGAQVRLFHACHNISKTEFQTGVTYLDLMNANAEVLKEALN